MRELSHGKVLDKIYICPIFKCDLTFTLQSQLEIREPIMSAGVWLTGKKVKEELDIE